MDCHNHGILAVDRVEADQARVHQVDTDSKDAYDDNQPLEHILMLQDQGRQEKQVHALPNVIVEEVEAELDPGEALVGQLELLNDEDKDQERQHEQCVDDQPEAILHILLDKRGCRHPISRHLLLNYLLSLPEVVESHKPRNRDESDRRQV